MEYLQKTICRVVEPIWKLWWKFHRNSLVSYGDKNFHTFTLKSQTGSFEGCEIRNFINLALYCSWIIQFNKGCYQTLSQKSKIQNSLFAFSMKTRYLFYPRYLFCKYSVVSMEIKVSKLFHWNCEQGVLYFRFLG